MAEVPISEDYSNIDIDQPFLFWAYDTIRGAKTDLTETVARLPLMAVEQARQLNEEYEDCVAAYRYFRSDATKLFTLKGAERKAAYVEMSKQWGPYAQFISAMTSFSERAVDTGFDQYFDHNQKVLMTVRVFCEAVKQFPWCYGHDWTANTEPVTDKAISRMWASWRSIAQTYLRYYQGTQSPTSHGLYMAAVEQLGLGAIFGDIESSVKRALVALTDCVTYLNGLTVTMTKELGSYQDKLDAAGESGAVDKVEVQRQNKVINNLGTLINEYDVGMRKVRDAALDANAETAEQNEIVYRQKQQRDPKLRKRTREVE